jgi:hypothetical protein
MFLNALMIRINNTIKKLSVVKGWTKTNLMSLNALMVRINIPLRS